MVAAGLVADSAEEVGEGEEVEDRLDR